MNILLNVLAVLMVSFSCISKSGIPEGGFYTECLFFVCFWTPVFTLLFPGSPLTPLRACIHPSLGLWTVYHKARTHNYSCWFMYLSRVLCQRMHYSTGEIPSTMPRSFFCGFWTEFTKTSIMLWSRVASLLWRWGCPTQQSGSREPRACSPKPLRNYCSLSLVNIVILSMLWVSTGFMDT